MNRFAWMPLGLALVSAGAVHAATVHVEGSGQWDSPILFTTPYSAAGESWAFSFDLPNPIAANPTTQATDFKYFLNGVQVSSTLLDVDFAAAAHGGMFDLDFADHSVGFEGPDVGSTLTLVPGVYSGVPAGIDQVIQGGSSGTITITAVPEPRVWTTLLAGAGLVGAALRRRAKVATC